MQPPTHLVLCEPALPLGVIVLVAIAQLAVRRDLNVQLALQLACLLDQGSKQSSWATPSYSAGTARPHAPQLIRTSRRRSSHARLLSCWLLGLLLVLQEESWVRWAPAHSKGCFLQVKTHVCFGYAIAMFRPVGGEASLSIIKEQESWKAIKPGAI